jgi:hypothetical protein
MRDTEHFKRHLWVVTDVDCKDVRTVAVEDPFHTTHVIVGWTFWGWLRMLFSRKREIDVRVKVRADEVALGRWFQGADICEHCKRQRIDGPGQHKTKPGYEHGDERCCETCYYEKPIPPSNQMAIGQSNQSQ